MRNENRASQLAFEKKYLKVFSILCDLLNMMSLTMFNIIILMYYFPVLCIYSLIVMLSMTLWLFATYIFLCSKACLFLNEIFVFSLCFKYCMFQTFNKYSIPEWFSPVCSLYLKLLSQKFQFQNFDEVQISSLQNLFLALFMTYFT